MVFKDKEYVLSDLMVSFKQGIRNVKVEYYDSKIAPKLTIIN